jgi:hypothetical protein
MREFTRWSFHFSDPLSDFSYIDMGILAYYDEKMVNCRGGGE